MQKQKIYSYRLAIYYSVLVTNFSLGKLYFFLKDGRLRTGDHILEIGGTNVQGMSSEQVAQVLRNCGNYVKMVVARDPVCEITVTPPTPLAQPVGILNPFQDRYFDTVSIVILIDYIVNYIASTIQL